MGTIVGEGDQKRYEWITWRDAVYQAECLSYGFMHLGLVPEIDAEGRKWRFISILAANCKEWIIAHVANMHQRITTIPLYQTLGNEAFKFVFNQTKLTSICTSERLAKVLMKLKAEDITGKTATLQNIIVIADHISQDLKEHNKESKFTLYTFNEVVAIGEKIKKEGKAKSDHSTTEDIFLFNYTSGTTGDPKGVKISHKGFLHTIESINARTRHVLDPVVTEDDSYISYMPFAHMGE